jgi:hypothetical protein
MSAVFLCCYRLRRISPLLSNILHSAHAIVGSLNAGPHRATRSDGLRRIFTDASSLQTEPPIDPPTLSRWRKRLGAGMKELLAQSMEAAKRASIKRVIVATTVITKAIAPPTESPCWKRVACCLSSRPANSSSLLPYVMDRKWMPCVPHTPRDRFGERGAKIFGHGERKLDLC